MQAYGREGGPARARGRLARSPSAEPHQHTNSWLLSMPAPAKPRQTNCHTRAMDVRCLRKVIIPTGQRHNGLLSLSSSTKRCLPSMRAGQSCRCFSNCYALTHRKLVKLETALETLNYFPASCRPPSPRLLCSYHDNSFTAHSLIGDRL